MFFSRIASIICFVAAETAQIIARRCRLDRSRAHDWKSCNSETSSRVRISPSPPSLFHNMEHIEKPLIIQGFFVFLSFFYVYCPTANISLFPYPRQARTHKRIKNPAYTEKPFPYHLKRKSDRKRLFFCISERCFL